jgi:hypothetical protein
MRFDLFESDGTRWLCRNLYTLYTRTQILMYEHVGKKKKNLFFRDFMCGCVKDGSSEKLVYVGRLF